MQDWELLQRYVKEGSQAAFAELAGRHMNMVYGACLREVGDRALAEDVTQVVFLLLARRAPHLRADTTLAGWLFQTARLASKNALKRERRRAARERRAHEMAEQRAQAEQADQRAWEVVGPRLNDALSSLRRREREIVLLRFIEGRTLAEVGTTLGLSEDAARMRVGRALEKLRRHLSRAGGVTSGAALTALLPDHAAQAAPPTFAASLPQIGSSLAGHDTALGANINQIYQGVTKAMWMTRAKIGAGLLAAALLATQVGAARHAFSAARRRPAAGTSGSRPATTKAQAQKTSGTNARLLQQLGNWELPDKFTLQYRVVTRDLTKPPASQAPAPSIVTLSAREGKLFLRKIDPQGRIGNVLVYDGTNTISYGVGSLLVSTAVDVQPGIPLTQILPCPFPGVGLPHVPLVTFVQPGPFTQSSTPGVWSAQGNVLRLDSGQNQLMYAPGQLRFTTRRGRLVLLSAVTTSSGTGEGRWDFTKPDRRWDFTNHRLFKGCWIAGRMRWTRFEGDAPAEATDFTLLSATESPLSADQFQQRAR